MVEETVQEVEYLATTRLGEKGQHTIPKAYRDILGLEPGVSTSALRRPSGATRSRRGCPHRGRGKSLERRIPATSTGQPKCVPHAILLPVRYSQLVGDRRPLCHDGAEALDDLVR